MLQAGAGGAGEQTADHGASGGDSGEAGQQQLNPPAPAPRRSGTVTDKGAAKQQ